MARRKRPIQLRKKEDLQPDTLERTFQHYDVILDDLDERKIAPVVQLDASETDVAVIVTKINELLALLNNSDLTS